MLVVENHFPKPEPDNAHARTLLPNFRGCQCPNEWLTGANAFDMAKRIANAANSNGLNVQGEPKITLFGETHNDQMSSGPTIEIVLGASGFAIDFWPHGFLRMTNEGEHGNMDVYGVGLGNLDWCNRDRVYNRNAIQFIRTMRDDVLCATLVDFSKAGKRRPINLTVKT